MMRLLSLIACLSIAAAASAAAPATAPATSPATSPATRPTTAPMVEDVGTDTTLITFSARQIPLANAIRQIGRQAHASTGLYPPPQAAAPMGTAASNPTVDVDVKAKPFWAVVFDLAQTNGLRLQAIADLPLALGRTGQSVSPGLTATAGPCYIFIPRISRDDLLDYADPKNPQRRLQLTLTCFIEPKIHAPKGVEVRITELSDDAGQPLLVSEAMPQPSVLLSNKLITLRRPPGDGRIALLKGEVRFNAPRRCPRWYIDDVVAASVPQSVQVDGKTCTLHAVRKIGATLEVEISVDGRSPTTRPADPAPVQLFDNNGLRLQMMRQAEVNGRMTVSFARSGATGAATEPFTLIWAFPAETQEFVCPFEFKNIRVP